MSGCVHQLVLGDHALDEARHLVGAAAGAGRHDELDRLGRLPCGVCRIAVGEARQCGCRAREGAAKFESDPVHVVSLTTATLGWMGRKSRGWRDRHPVHCRDARSTPHVPVFRIVCGISRG